MSSDSEDSPVEERENLKRRKTISNISTENIIESSSGSQSPAGRRYTLRTRSSSVSYRNNSTANKNQDDSMESEEDDDEVASAPKNIRTKSNSKNQRKSAKVTSSSESDFNNEESDSSESEDEAMDIFQNEPSISSNEIPNIPTPEPPVTSSANNSSQNQRNRRISAQQNRQPRNRVPVENRHRIQLPRPTSDSSAEEEEQNEDAEDEAPRRRVRVQDPEIIAQRQRARRKKEQGQIFEHHPELETVWDELKEIAVVVPEKVSQPATLTVDLLPFQMEGVSWLIKQEQSNFHGGILADEMGMGKTIQMIGLLVSTPEVKPNLILCPTVALLQWRSELQDRTKPGTLSVCVFHGSSRSDMKVKDLQKYDVVLSTYALVENGFRKQHYGTKRKNKKSGEYELVRDDSILHQMEWGRVVLDEAHAIKDRSCSTARAVFALNTSRRWSLSGTPLQNRVGELYSLIRFMNADPFSYYFCKKCPCKLGTWSFKNGGCDQCGHQSHSHFCWWNMEILKPIQRDGATGEGLEAFNKLRILLDRIMLRRTKIQCADDLGLPPRVVTIRRDVFNQAEEELYESLYTETQRQFQTYVQANTILNNYASIFSLLSRMRLAANHPDLVTTRLNMKANDVGSLVCGICQDLAEDPVVSKCKHIFCREDIRQYIESDPEEKPKCPVCFKVLTIDLTQTEFEPEEDGEVKKGAKKVTTGSQAYAKTSYQSSIVNHIDLSRWRSSTKVEALVEELHGLQKEDSTAKSIVFSQFVSFLDLIAWRLTRSGFGCVKLDGRMSPEQRKAVIDSFMTDPTITVFLVSLKAGGVALNLTEASRVFVMDPWWNPAVEDQAFDRIHRLGQHRPIKITRLIIENSIESRIIQLQEKKKALFESTVGKDIDALGKLSQDDLQFLFVL